MLIMWAQQECIQISNHNLFISEFYTTGILYSFSERAGAGGGGVSASNTRFYTLMGFPGGSDSN